MTLLTLNAILNWFIKYQWKQDQKEMATLYEKLIEEELTELRTAEDERNLDEYLDAIWDSLWVYIWYYFFAHDSKSMHNINDFFVQLYLKFNADCKFKWEWHIIIDEILTAIAMSNFTKELKLQEEWAKVWKVIKWKNFKKPNIKAIIKKYNISFKK